MSKEVKELTPDSVANENSSPETQRVIDYFEVTMEGVQELGEAVNSLVPNKYAKQALISAMNDILKPVFK